MNRKSLPYENVVVYIETSEGPSAYVFPNAELAWSILVSMHIPKDSVAWVFLEEMDGTMTFQYYRRVFSE